MPVEVKVGPPILTINRGSVFMVTNLRGMVAPGTAQGLYCDDTRFVSEYRLFIDGQPWDTLTAETVSYYAAKIELVNPEVRAQDSRIDQDVLGLTITREIDEGVHEDLRITNYDQSEVRFRLEVELRSDFADIMEVKERHPIDRGGITTAWRDGPRELAQRYEQQDFKRQLLYRVAEADSPPTYANGRLVFDITLGAKGTWRACILFMFVQDGKVRRTPRRHHELEGDAELDRLQREWRQVATRLSASSDVVTHTFRQSVEDMGALRLFGQPKGRGVWFPAAGVPWFVAVFGRDSLIASLQNMIVHPEFALGALEHLAHYQATEADDARDAQPGKIVHEVRSGEWAHFKKFPSPYYGTWDATPLYLIVLHEAWKWLGDLNLLRTYRDVALRCLEWIDHFGDLDGDGFQEYQKRTPHGYENMGWKDSGRAVVYPNGRQVPQPKALCELQGYVFDAKLRMAEVFDALDEPDRAADLRRHAAQLRHRFEEAFWCEDAGTYAFGLDPDKQPIRTVVSNPGHLLWSGIVRPDRARRVAARLLQEDTWSGWGIRTLSTCNPAYNPYLYQLGAVWPHDNGIIALGCSRYGLYEEAARIAKGILDAADTFKAYRLPELFSGLARERLTFPVQYKQANIPQAWAAGCAFHFVQALLGLRADAPAGRLYVHPTLPPWLEHVRLDNLEVGRAVIALDFYRDGERSRWEVCDQQGELEVVESAWAPWDDPQPRAPGGRD